MIFDAKQRPQNMKCCNGTTNQCKKCRDKVQADRMMYKRPDYGFIIFGRKKVNDNLPNTSYTTMPAVIL